MDFLRPLPIITNMINIENNPCYPCNTDVSNFLAVGCDMIPF
jgi:hypothetical protein